MELSSYVGLKQKDIISIVGAGGKTSFMFQLAQDIKKNNGKVLVTTSTKIYVPQKEQYDFICIGEKEFSKYADMQKKGIYIYGTKVNLENKIIGLGEKYLYNLVSKFDYTLIEADGAKKKQIKGWNENEPVIYGGTTKTIGILDIQTVGMKICESTVHRSEQFCKITNSHQGENITLEHLLNIIFHPQGLFKNDKGEKILFINKADDSYYLNQAEELKNKINKYCSRFLNKIVIGSIKSKYIYEKGVKILL